MTPLVRLLTATFGFSALVGVGLWLLGATTVACVISAMVTAAVLLLIAGATVLVASALHRRRPAA